MHQGLSSPLQLLTVLLLVLLLCLLALVPWGAMAWAAEWPQAQDEQLQLADNGHPAKPFFNVV